MSYSIKITDAYEPQRAFQMEAAASGGDTNVTASVKALTLTKYAATVSIDREVIATVKALVLSAKQATITIDRNVLATVKALTLAEQGASVSIDRTVNAGVKALTLSGKSATVSLDHSISANVHALTLTEYAATITVIGDTVVNASVHTLTLTAFPATVTLDRDVQAGSDALTLATQAATISIDREVQAGTDALTLATYQATVTLGALDIEVLASTDELTLVTYPATVEIISTPVVPVQGVTTVQTSLGGGLTTMMLQSVPRTLKAGVSAEITAVNESTLAVKVIIDNCDEAIVCNETIASFIRAGIAEDNNLLVDTKSIVAVLMSAVYDNELSTHNESKVQVASEFIGDDAIDCLEDCNAAITLAITAKDDDEIQTIIEVDHQFIFRTSHHSHDDIYANDDTGVKFAYGISDDEIVAVMMAVAYKEFISS